MGDWTHRHACEILRGQQYPTWKVTREVSEAIDKVCDAQALYGKKYGDHLRKTNMRAIAKRLQTTIANIKYQDYEVYRDDMDKLEYVLEQIKGEALPEVVPQ